MNKVTPAMSIAVAGMAIVFSLAAPHEGRAQGAVVEPGQTVFFAAADDLDLDFSGCSGGNICLAQGLTADAKVEVMTIIAGGPKTRHAQATLQNFFTLSGDPQLERVLRGNLSGTISWAGRLFIAGVTQVEATITSKVRLTDVTEGRVVAEQQVLNESCSDVGCLKFPQGSAPYNLSVDLIRGHQYRFDFVGRCQSYIGILGADVICEFFYDPNDVSRGPIRLAVQRDLEEEIDALRSELRTLKRRFNTHTHTYLTGKGVGHNNTEATTSTPPK